MKPFIKTTLAIALGSAFSINAVAYDVIGSKVLTEDTTYSNGARFDGDIKADGFKITAGKDAGGIGIRLSKDVARLTAKELEVAGTLENQVGAELTVTDTLTSHANFTNVGTATIGTLNGTGISNYAGGSLTAKTINLGSGTLLNLQQGTVTITSGVMKGTVQNSGILYLNSEDAKIDGNLIHLSGSVLQQSEGKNLKNLTVTGEANLSSALIIDDTLSVSRANIFSDLIAGKFIQTNQTNESYSIFREGANATIGTYEAQNGKYGLKVEKGQASIDVIETAGANAIDGGTLTIKERANVGGFYNSGTVNAENADVVIRGDGALTDQYAFTNGLIVGSLGNIKGTRAATITVGKLTVHGNAYNEGSSTLNTTNITVTETFENDGQVGIKNGQADFNHVKGANGSFALNNASVTIGNSSDLGSVEATNSKIVNGVDSNIVISTLKGTDNTITVRDTRAAQIEIKANKSENLVLTTSKPGFADAVPGNNPGSALQELADAVNINTNEAVTDTQGMTVKIGSGNVLGELTGTTDLHGNIVSFTEAVNETNQVLHTTANLPMLAWRAELNDLHKRLGDVRLTPQKSGAWVRYNGGEMEWSDGDLENKFDMIQVGIDTAPIDNEFRFGTAFSYTKGDTTMTGGSADLDTYSLAAYGSWVAQSGLYVDVIGRMANLKSDVTAVNAAGLTAYNGKLDNVALSLSTELGWRFDVTDMLFVEPQVEATYSYVNEESFKYEDRTYRMSAQDSAIVRAGFLAGLQCPSDKGNVYVRASVVHDFLGENELKVSNGTNSRTIENDFGGTWVEYGVGANFTIGNNTLVYADFERTSGGEIEQPWRVNLGLRYAF